MWACPRSVQPQLLGAAGLGVVGKGLAGVLDVLPQVSPCSLERRGSRRCASFGLGLALCLLPSCSVPAGAGIPELPCGARKHLVFGQEGRWDQLGLARTWGTLFSFSPAPQYVNILPSPPPSCCWQWDKAQPLRSPRAALPLCPALSAALPGENSSPQGCSAGGCTFSGPQHRDVLPPRATRRGRLAEGTSPAVPCPAVELELKHKGHPPFFAGDRRSRGATVTASVVQPGQETGQPLPTAPPKQGLVSPCPWHTSRPSTALL